MKRYITAIIVWLISIGWIIPISLSSYFMWIWIDTEAAPVVYDFPPQVNSFPLLTYAGKLFKIGGVWCLIVVVIWSGFMCWKIFAKQKD
jgi:hypothetical protein